ncbi:cytochrome C551 [Alkalihalobacillus alcalophilus ATCC 27647 = CGMCC 1.3604]|uniref:Cytochrome C551 n=1 Tax=Alkalihalobacillus alcalophilus ATCC 27647 = CGMCC 1.3604 TaxID=1218173 RepID=A0A094WFM5_ALKAL|nr:c-type cytochrome [Alkalihalobacillus alcalophilus]KGA95571.1 cytochrome C551 [Alkalihalobacillus alcalophilus ATCC 27647 = CGMCC 1.3604]MED1561555.1 c-type cytochrome [Alkalihalobacillus alcalophilus]THG91741.1 cytochrome C551 [Alkalihalobacillus alcalophilus ATCC 27647 = CGMCC 1.3604]
MKKFLIALGLVVALTACGGATDENVAPEEDAGTEAPADEEVDSGAEGTVDADAARGTYEQSCIGCHGGDLAGGAGPGLVGTGYSPDEILTIIQEGKGTMPGFPNIPDNEAENLAIWISEQ